MGVTPPNADPVRAATALIKASFMAIPRIVWLFGIGR
jgi:hypothetical protein